MNSKTREPSNWFETSPMLNETTKKQGMLTETRKHSHSEKTYIYFLATGISLDWRYSFLLNSEICNLAIKNAR